MKCRVEGCGKLDRRGPLCSMHYSRLRRIGNVDGFVPDVEDVGAVLDWILDGEPLTTPFERAQHELLVPPVLAGVAV